MLDENENEIDDFSITVDEGLGPRLLSIHNTRFLIKMMEEVREAIKKDKFLEYKEEFLTKYKKK